MFLAELFTGNSAEPELACHTTCTHNRKRPDGSQQPSKPLKSPLKRGNFEKLVTWPKTKNDPAIFCWDHPSQFTFFRLNTPPSPGDERRLQFTKENIFICNKCSFLSLSPSYSNKRGRGTLQPKRRLYHNHHYRRHLHSFGVYFSPRQVVAVNQQQGIVDICAVRPT